MQDPYDWMTSREKSDTICALIKEINSLGERLAEARREKRDAEENLYRQRETLDWKRTCRFLSHHTERSPNTIAKVGEGAD